jgi:hypothetical protein
MSASISHSISAASTNTTTTSRQHHHHNEKSPTTPSNGRNRRSGLKKAISVSALNSGTSHRPSNRRETAKRISSQNAQWLIAGAAEHSPTPSSPTTNSNTDDTSNIYSMGVLSPESLSKQPAFPNNAFSSPTGKEIQKVPFVQNGGKAMPLKSPSGNNNKEGKNITPKEKKTTKDKLRNVAHRFMPTPKSSSNNTNKKKLGGVGLINKRYQTFDNLSDEERPSGKTNQKEKQDDEASTPSPTNNDIAGSKLSAWKEQLDSAIPALEL